MSTFDYEASAKLFAAKGRPGFRYQRFAQAAEAIRYAIERLPPRVLAGERALSFDPQEALVVRVASGY
jgi:hypothetical protein